MNHFLNIGFDVLQREKLATGSDLLIYFAERRHCRTARVCDPVIILLREADAGCDV